MEATTADDVRWSRHACYPMRRRDVLGRMHTHTHTQGSGLGGRTQWTNFPQKMGILMQYRNRRTTMELRSRESQRMGEYWTRWVGPTTAYNRDYSKKKGMAMNDIKKRTFVMENSTRRIRTIYVIYQRGMYGRINL